MVRGYEKRVSLLINYKSVKTKYSFKPFILKTIK